MPKATDIAKVKTGLVRVLFSEDDIRHRIYTIRGVQVMLDRDLAMMYGVESRVLIQAVKRNMMRFPAYYMFQLTAEDLEILKSQIVIPNFLSDLFDPKKGRGGNRFYPYAFTEQGVSQLSSVLKSGRAIEMSIHIMDAFVAMRRYLAQNAGMLQRLDDMERHQALTDKKIDDTNTRIDRVLDQMEDGTLKQKLGIFFDGQMFDAFVLVEELIQKATRRIVLIDDYVTAAVLQRFHQRKAGVTLDCYVKSKFNTVDLQDAFSTYSKQYPTEATRLHIFEGSHDRWMIVDDTVYHFGASLKDLGKRWFSVDVITEHTAEDLIARL